MLKSCRWFACYSCCTDFKVTLVSICFHVKLNEKYKIYLYLHKLLELMWKMFPITWLRNYMIVGQNQSQTLKHHLCQNDLHVYHVFNSTVTGSKNNLTLLPVANFIDSFIG